MKRIIFALTVALITTFTSTSFAFDYNAPTCILIKFSNDTRYKNIDSADMLSDLVISKMLKGRKFNLKETKPIDEDMETMLYNEKIREITNAQVAMNLGNFNVLFEGPGFNSKFADSIATADVGQIISPAITSIIGKKHNAQYLIQGTIINLGNGVFDDDMNVNWAGGGGFYLRQKESAIGIQTDLRVIKASTGEVVWRKIVTSIDKKTLTQVGVWKFGTAKLSSDMYSQVMEDASQKIMDTFLEDLNANKLFI